MEQSHLGSVHFENLVTRLRIRDLRCVPGPAKGASDDPPRRRGPSRRRPGAAGSDSESAHGPDPAARHQHRERTSGTLRLVTPWRGRRGPTQRPPALRAVVRSEAEGAASPPARGRLDGGGVGVRVGGVGAQPALLEDAALVARAEAARAARDGAGDGGRHARHVVVDPAVVLEPAARQPRVPVHAAQARRRTRARRQGVDCMPRGGRLLEPCAASWAGSEARRRSTGGTGADAGPREVMCTSQAKAMSHDGTCARTPAPRPGGGKPCPSRRPSNEERRRHRPSMAQTHTQTHTRPAVAVVGPP